MLAAAGEFLNDAILTFNTKLYECNKIGPVVLTLTDGVVTLPTLFYKELECASADSDGHRGAELQYMDWAEYQHTYGTGHGSLTSLGNSRYYTVFNRHLDTTLQLLPVRVPPDIPVTEYIQLTYYRRFPLLAGENDVLDAPQEIERALVLHAQADIIRTYRSSDSALIGVTQGLAEQAWARFSAIDTRHPDMKPRFRLPPRAAHWLFDDTYNTR